MDIMCNEVEYMRKTLIEIFGGVPGQLIVPGDCSFVIKFDVRNLVDEGVLGTRHCVIWIFMPMAAIARRSPHADDCLDDEASVSTEEPV